MLANELTQYIIDNDLIIPLLEKLGCKHIETKSFQKDIRCALPDGDNPTSVSVRKDTLFVNVYSRGVNGNIYDFVSYLNNNCSFYNALKKVHELLGIPFDRNQVKKNTPDVLAVYKAARGKKYNNKPLETEGYPLSELNKYVKLPHKSWIDDGCTFDACQRYSLVFDNINSAVVIPWFKWAIPPQQFEKPIAGFVRRTTIPNAKELGIPKYRCEKGFDKGAYLFGLAQNYYDIKKAGYVVVFEAEKSVVQRASYGAFTGVAVGSHEITAKQRQMLVALGVEIIVAFDKDIPEEFLQETCRRFYNVRKLSYILDTQNILGETESPADKTNLEYQKLFKERKIYG